ncbi:MAG TPA: hypothetical protein PKZ76_12140 [Xanthomonadaceae bacterium]|nr:hypothetical protein [Xanthomonadaceae bacterium]
MIVRVPVLFCLLASAALPGAAELSDEACSTASTIFANGFAPGPPLGSFDMQVEVSGQGTRTFRVHAAASLMPPHRHALLITLHGAGGPGTAPAAASFMRDAWSATADAGGFLVLAPIASGAQGGWVPSLDYPALAAAIDALQALYPVDTRRRYLHGFSAGGHVVHDLGLYNANYFAAYVANAGVLDALAGANAPAQALRHIPVQVRVGNSDTLLTYAQTDRNRFLAAGWSEPADYQLVVFAGGHSFDAGHTGPAWDFLCRRARLP